MRPRSDLRGRADSEIEPRAARHFTREELACRHGLGNMPAWVACEGRIYDVSGSFLWRDGRHQALHSAGRDLTEELARAPHGVELLQQFPLVGWLVEE